MASAEFPAEAFAHQGTGIVQTYDFHVRAVTAVLFGDRVQRRNSGGVPEARGVHIDDHMLRVQGVFELRVEVVGGGEEQLPVHHVGRGLTPINGFDGPFDRDEVCDPAGEHHHRHQDADADADADGDVVRGDHHDDRGDHDRVSLLGIIFRVRGRMLCQSN
ncbi:MAG: hypothetical protein JWM13_433, partial [Arthrobacter sp.]|nr:hypothetical protein [Arthrobacter sp.]